MPGLRHRGCAAPWGGRATRAVVALTTAALALLRPAAAAAQRPQSAVSAAVNVGASEQGLRSGDVIRLRIWREPELSGDFPVDESGVAVLPKIGPLNVRSQTPAALKARLVAAYEEWLQHTSVQVMLLHRVQVLGAVRNPGLYPVDGTMTVSDALALAGGTTPQGNPDRIDLIRDGRRLEAKLTGRTRIAQSPIQSGDEIFVRERRWVSRNSAVVASAVTATVSLLIAFLR